MATYGWADISTLLVGGYDFLPYIVQEITLPEASAILDEARPAGSAWITRRDSTQRQTKNPLSFMCDYDDTAADTTDAGPDALLATLPTGALAAIVAIEGGTVGTKAVCGLVKVAEYERIPSDSRLTRVKCTAPVNGALSTGFILADQATQRTADFSGTSVDNGLAATAVTITSSSVANPSVITTAAAHGLVTGDTVLIASHSGSTPDINGTHTVTVTGTTTFTVPVNVTVGGTGGTSARINTRNGGRAFISLPDTTACPFALGGHSGLAAIVEGSADDSSWATVATFTTLTARGDEVIEVSGNVPRYLRVTVDFTGAGSPTANPVVAFSRYPE